MGFPEIKKLIQSLIVAMLIGFVTGCDIGDKLVTESENWRQVTENVLNDAIGSLNTASNDWQSILQDVQQKLPEQVQTTVRVEVGNLVSRGIAQSGTELRCSADFLGDRAKEGLQRIKQKFLGRRPSPVKPVFCSVVPSAIERDKVPSRIPQLEFYGYNFDYSNGLRVYLVNSSGQKQDVTSKLDHPTHYAMTLKFGANGVKLKNNSSRFVLELNGRQLSSVGIIQPEVPACIKKTERFIPNMITFMPRHTRGDREFDGNGPTVDTRVSLIRDSRKIRAKVSMKAYESRSDGRPKGDNTTAFEEKVFTLFNAPPGYRIMSATGSYVSTHRYTDDDHSIDTFNLPSGGPVKRLVYVGDTRGRDAGTRTKVDIEFNRLNIHLRQVGHCR